MCPWRVWRSSCAVRSALCCNYFFVSMCGFPAFSLFCLYAAALLCSSFATQEQNAQKNAHAVIQLSFVSFSCLSLPLLCTLFLLSPFFPDVVVCLLSPFNPRLLVCNSFVLYCLLLKTAMLPSVPLVPRLMHMQATASITSNGASASCCQKTRTVPLIQNQRQQQTPGEATNFRT